MHRELGKKSGGLLSRAVRVRRPGDAPPFGMTKLEGQRPKEGPIGPRPSRIVFPTSSFLWLAGIRSSDFPQIFCRSGPIGRGVPLRTGRLKVRILPAAPLSERQPVEEPGRGANADAPSPACGASPRRSAIRSTAGSANSRPASFEDACDGAIPSPATNSFS